MTIGKIQILLALIFMAVLVLSGGPPSARADSLKVGDEAPGFALETWERDATVTLGSFRGERPVVLIFGSYT